MWLTQRRMTPVGQARYSDLAIEICLTLGAFFSPTTAPDPRLDATRFETAGSWHHSAGFSTLSRRSTEDLSALHQPQKF
ncbi:MAG: hypothetical protein ACKVKF_19630 [Rhodobacterales bacterium]|uniref:hypothetical protein n=1 Tax=Puniceibacterium antarcticum TaxID=1206336 RepID=UPI003CCC088A